jgi:hypothetical protein
MQKDFLNIFLQTKGDRIMLKLKASTTNYRKVSPLLLAILSIGLLLNINSMKKLNISDRSIKAHC